MTAQQQGELAALVYGLSKGSWLILLHPPAVQMERGLMPLLPSPIEAWKGRDLALWDSALVSHSFCACGLSAGC